MSATDLRTRVRSTRARLTGGIALILLLAASTALWRQGTAGAAATTQVLHSADTTVGATVYNSMSTAAVVGVLDTATASLANKNNVVSFQDAGGVQVFTSSAVPADAQWSIGGAWTFNAYVRATTSTRLYMRAQILRVESTGASTVLATTSFTSRRDVGTSYQLITWNHTLAANTLVGGQSFAVRFQMQPDSDNAGQNAILGFDAASAASNVIAQLTSTPDAPSSVAASAGIAQATVTWDAPATGGSAITGYTVTASPGGQTAAVGGSTLTANVTGLSNGTAYTFTVTATNAIGTGPASAPSNSVTPAGTPDAPTSAAAVAGNAQATVSWVAPVSNGGSAITGYTVTSSPGGLTASVGGSTLAATVTGLTNGTAYTFTVTASNAVTTSVASAPSNSVTPSAAPAAPGAPTAVTASAGDAQATMTWTAAPSNGSAITGYTVISSPGGLTASVGGSTLAATVTGLTNGTAYTFTVTATNAIGTGPASSPSNSVTPNAGGLTAPGAPQNVSAAAGVGQATVSWSAPASDGGSPITSYTALSSPGGLYVTVTGAELSGVVTGLSSGVPYTFTVVATNAIGASPASAPSNTVMSGSAPDAPTGVTAVPGNGYASVTWLAPASDGGSPITSYTVTSTPGGVVATVDALSLTASVLGLTNGTAYTFTVVASTALGTSAPSAASNSVTPSTAGWPPLPASQPPAHNSHLVYTGETAACAGCHRVHTSPAPRTLYKTWPEENVCFTCHDGSAAPNIMSQFAKSNRMPITSTVGIHSKDEARTRSAVSFSGDNRHVECADCHNPHLAGAGNHQLGTNYTAGPQQGVWGVAVSNTAPWTAPTFTTTYPVTMQYQLCFKCHSSWAYGASPPLSPSGGFPQTDQAKEFNTLNPSYHPVEDIGKNPFVKASGASYASSLINSLTPSSRIVCADCHTSETPGDPAGPHGSNRPFILRGTWDRTTGQSGTSDHLCFTCHAWTTYGPGSSTSATGFYSPDRGNLHGIMVGARNKANNDSPIVCMDCHVAVPHGYQRDHLLGFSGDGAPYINRPYSGGLVSIDTWRASGQWTFSSCDTAMNSCK